MDRSEWIFNESDLIPSASIAKLTSASSSAESQHSPLGGNASSQADAQNRHTNAFSWRSRQT
jgi:hypothetical protein